MLRIIFLLSVFIFCQASAQTTKVLQRGQILPALEYTALDKTIIKLDWKEQAGNVFIIDFWATWCAPCIESIGHMDSLISRFGGKKVKFISITYEPERIVTKFLYSHPMHSEIGLDCDFRMFRAFNGWAIPNLVMINSAGLYAGRIHPNQLNEDVINSLLAGKIPEVKNTREDMFDPIKAEEYFRSFLEKQKGM